MSAQGSSEGGYTWSGELGATDVRALYARCQSLRLSGLLELTDGGKSAQVSFIGGDPVETHGADTDAVRKWRSGSFRVVQRVPDLRGALTAGVALSGGIAAQSRPKDLIRHCEDARLTCDLELSEVSGGRAKVRFAHGKVELTELNGKPDLAALRHVADWTAGSYQIVLRPLFGDDAPRTPPPMILKGAPPTGQMFDFTAPVRISDDDDDDDPIKTPAPMEISFPNPIASGFEDSADRPTEERPLPGESTALTKPLPPPPKPPRPPGAVEQRARPPARPLPPGESTSLVRNPGPRRRARWPWVAGLLVVAAALSTPWVLPRLGVKLPFALPFHLPGTPGLAAPPVAATTSNSTSGPIPTAPPRKPAEEPKHADRRPVERVEHPERPVAATRPKRSEPEERERPSAELRLIEKARRLLVEGHAHSAQDAIKSARRYSPHDELLDLLEKMSRGKTGRAELLLDGKGTVTVDYHRFKAPAKLKLPAGPHLLGDEGDERLDLAKGERRHVEASQ